MKHSFKNLANYLASDLKKKAYMNKDVDRYFESVDVLKKAYNTYYNDVFSFNMAVEDAGDHSIIKEQDGGIEYIESLIREIIADSDLSDIDKSHEWGELVGNIEEKYATDLEKELKALRASLKVLEGFAEASLTLYKKFVKELK